MPHICILSTSTEFRTKQQEGKGSCHTTRRTVTLRGPRNQKHRTVTLRDPRNQKQSVRFRSVQSRSQTTQTTNLKIESLDTCGWFSTPSFTVWVATLGRAANGYFFEPCVFFFHSFEARIVRLKLLLGENGILQAYLQNHLSLVN
jgi:hypothetical protein